MAKTMYWIQHTKIEAKRNGDKDGKALRRLMNNAVCRKTNRTDVKLVKIENDFLKCTSKLSCMSHKILHYNLVAIRKSKVSWKRNKSAYIRMCILELSKVLSYEFHYNYITNKYDNKSKLLLTDTDKLMYEIKTEDV